MDASGDERLEGWMSRRKHLGGLMPGKMNTGRTDAGEDVLPVGWMPGRMDSEEDVRYSDLRLASLSLHAHTCVAGLKRRKRKKWRTGNETLPW